ncbi:uncharacterized protein CCOS01_10399 [Colletotrichum costaricense]|uniref:Uncharacterized protein n=1 Tax=Colletotrichum costaricense TaxID=1209916 RepID=A0AAJ0DY52_9PEZI|nr:uncharacterized protein CCOS01_10399 [Colletotrichum costaricense]KAK1520280.1 hypothetical protein CCOS01_10399 [Colletotrichum costaricense]
MSTDMGGRNLEASHEKTPAAQQCSTKNTKLAVGPQMSGKRRGSVCPDSPRTPANHCDCGGTEYP